MAPKEQAPHKLLKKPENISELDRREFLKMGLWVTGVFAGGSIFSSVSEAAEVVPLETYRTKYPYQPHYCMVVRLYRGIGCQ